MSRVLALSALILAISAVVLAIFVLPGGCRNGGPDRLVVEPAKLDFGAVLHGEVIERELVLRNHRQQDIYVTNALGNCACLQIGRFDRVVRPGEEERITVKLVTTLVPPARLRGKQLDVLSNDPLYPRIEIPVEADIIQPVSVIPSQLDFGPGPPGSAFEALPVKVRPGPGLRLRLLGWRSSPVEALEVSHEKSEGGVDFRIRPADSAPQAGPFRAALIFRVEVAGEAFAPRELNFTVDVVGR